MAFLAYKPAQPLVLRQLNRQYELENKSKSKRQRFRPQFNQQFKEAVENLAIEFGRKSTIHGMNRLFQEKSNKYERCFWLLTLICAILGSIYVCLILSQRFNAGAIQTVVESTNKPVFHIPFPEVTICNANHLNWARLEEAKHHFMPYENDTERLRMFELVIGLYDNISFGEFKAFETLEGEPIELVQNINFTLVYDFMTWHCDELFTHCSWRHYKMNCCDIFSKSSGQSGICWHFNTLSNEVGRRKQMLDNKYPWRVGSAGPTSALTVRVMINEKKHFRQDNEKGILISIMEPTVWHREPYWVPANTEAMVDVEPVIFSYDNETRSLPSKQRQCVFNNEHNNYEFKSLNGFNYMHENCLSQCQQEHLLRYCNCTVDFLFPPAEYKACQIKDFLCLARYNDNFRFTHQPGSEKYLNSTYPGMVCNCYRNCYSLNYIADVRPSFLPGYIRQNKTYVDLDVHFRFEEIMVYRTGLVFGWVDLMVAFGGIAGLFLGCSLISAMELFYFALVEFPVFVFKEFKNKDNLEPSNKQREQQNNQRPIKRRNWGLNNRIMASQQSQNHDFSIYKNELNHSNAKNEVLQLWTQQYFVTNKNNF